jgi:hypothetical protein
LTRDTACGIRGFNDRAPLADKLGRSIKNNFCRSDYLDAEAWWQYFTGVICPTNWQQNITIKTQSNFFVQSVGHLSRRWVDLNRRNTGRTYLRESQRNGRDRCEKKAGKKTAPTASLDFRL